MKPVIVIAALVLAALVHSRAEAGDIAGILEARFAGDRTGACVAAAVIGEEVRTAIHCADKARRIDADTAFEIGSITKTMNGLLLAQLVEAGTLGLDDPIADHLPEGTKVPSFEGEPIRLRHLLTHTAGLPALPARFAPKRGDNPYADLTEAQLLGSLGDVTLTARPGTQFAYSNFGAMVLSTIIDGAADGAYAAQMQAGVFAPIGMDSAFVTKAPRSVAVAEGHLGTGKATAAWTFPESMAGVGAVRASLNDLVRYVQVQLAPDRVPSLASAIRRSQEKLAEAGQPVAWGWMVRNDPAGNLYAHEGGTGGFSSLALFQPATGKGVVILSDTALTDLGGLGDVARALLAGDAGGLAPRREQDAPAALLAALEGDWLINGGLPMRLWQESGELWTQAQGQSAFRMGHDSSGQFFARDFDAVLVPMKAPDGQYSLILRQGGGAMPVTRPAPPKPAIAIDARTLEAYPGEYPLAPGFVLTVSVRDGVLHAQATGQGAFPLVPEAADVFTARAYGIEIRFARDDAGKVSGLTLLQAGRETKANKQ